MALFASDTFTGTATTELSAYSANWVKHPLSGANTIILSNENRCFKAGANVEALYYNQQGTAASVDYSVQANIFVKSVIGDTSIVGRCSSTLNNMYLARYSVTGWQLFKRVNGTFTQLGATSVATLNIGQTYKLKLQMIGTTISVLVDDVSLISVTDASVTTTGFAGVRTSTGTFSDSIGLHLDDFKAYDGSVEPPPPSTGGRPTHIHLSSGVLL